MPSTTALAAPAPPHVAPWGRGARACRWVLIVCWVALTFVALLAGEREATLSDLEDAVASGEVQEVRVAGGLATGERGRASAQVRWDQGLVTYTTALVEERPRPSGPSGASGASGASGPSGAQRGDDPVVADVEARLRALQPELRVARTGWTGGGASVLGWGLPAWAGLLHLGVLLGTLFSLTGSPQPWRATRWAWFWLLVLVPPIGVPAYLLLAGPTPPVPAPSLTRRRTTGGGGFLLGIVGSLGLAVLVAWLA
ncbi:hypothetical protein [Nocardioides sp.]|uniref:hypothetical protein n=1 Tax=Nocardioides sp. TaxID=35761 RepID=UPI00286C9EC6|nr:hypothetical protein [Nocardioides sp.]